MNTQAVPGSIGADWRTIEEFFCCICELAQDGAEVWVCEHGEAFDCCIDCGNEKQGLECDGLPHQTDWKKERK